MEALQYALPTSTSLRLKECALQTSILDIPPVHLRVLPCSPEDIHSEPESSSTLPAKMNPCCAMCSETWGYGWESWVSWMWSRVAMWVACPMMR